MSIERLPSLQQQSYSLLHSTEDLHRNSTLHPSLDGFGTALPFNGDPFQFQPECIHVCVLIRSSQREVLNGWWWYTKKDILNTTMAYGGVPFTDPPESSWPVQGPPHRSFCGMTHTGSSRGQQAQGSSSVWSGSLSEQSAGPPPPPLMSTVKHTAHSGSLEV